MTRGARWLDPKEARAWRGYRRMRLLLDSRIARDMAHESGLSEPDYDVLTNLSERPGYRWSRSELAAHMLWSMSRLSHHLSRMEQRGLVRRKNDDADARKAIAELTKKGLRAVEEAAPPHVESVRRHFIDLLTDKEIEVLGDIAEKVLAHLGERDFSGRGSPRD